MSSCSRLMCREAAKRCCRSRRGKILIRRLEGGNGIIDKIGVFLLARFGGRTAAQDSRYVAQVYPSQHEVSRVQHMSSARYPTYRLPGTLLAMRYARYRTFRRSGPRFALASGHGGRFRQHLWGTPKIRMHRNTASQLRDRLCTLPYDASSC